MTPNGISRHRGSLVFATYVAAVLLGAALLAPVFFAGGKAFITMAAAHGWRASPWIGWIVRAAETTEFPGYFDRAALVVALAGLWPLFRLLRMTRAEVAGEESWPRGAANAAIGFTVAAAAIALLGAGFSILGVCRFRPGDAWSVLMPAVSGLSVACIEEFMFRGAMLGVLRRSMGARAALLATTVVFAFLHFLKPPGDGAIPDESVTWSSGFRLIPRLFEGFARWENVVAEFLLLFAVGWALAGARIATNGLGLCIGLHAGWVAAMKCFSQLAGPTAALRRGEFFPWVTENHCKAIVGSYVGLVPVAGIVLSGALATVWRRQRGRKQTAAGS